MKKLMTLMLGLSLVIGATSVFADDTKSTDTKSTSKKQKKQKKSKPTDTKMDSSAPKS